MNPEFRKIALIAAVLGLIVALFFAFRPGDDELAAPPATTAAVTRTGAETTIVAPPAPSQVGPTEIPITVVGGRPEGGIQRPSLTKGERAVLVIASDVADEVHLHGYDLSVEVEAGGTARIPFTATVPGRFELELEQRGVQLADLEVRP